LRRIIFIISLVTLINKQCAVGTKFSEHSLLGGFAALAVSEINSVALSLGTFDEDAHHTEGADDVLEGVRGAAHFAVDIFADGSPAGFVGFHAFDSGDEQQFGVDDGGFGAIAGIHILDHLSVGGVGLAEGVDDGLEVTLFTVLLEEGHNTTARGHETPSSDVEATARDGARRRRGATGTLFVLVDVLVLLVLGAISTVNTRSRIVLILLLE